MKNWFYITIATLLAVSAGCSKVELADTPSKAISFTVGAYSAQTRADDNYASVYGRDKVFAFKSRAFFHAGGVADWNNYFPEAGETVTAHTSAGTAITAYSEDSVPAEWLPSQEYYWPKGTGSYIDFISWYGGSPAISYGSTSAATTFAWQNLTVATTDNLMWADVAWHFNAHTSSESNNTMFGYKTDEPFGQDQVTGGVPTLFHHALAQVCFQAKQSKVSETENGKTVQWIVDVTDFKVTNVCTTGSFSLSITDPGTSVKNATRPWTESGDGLGWTNVAGPAEIPVTLEDPIELSEEATELMEWSSVIPQSLVPATGSTTSPGLEISFTVTTKYGDMTVEEAVEGVAVSLSDFNFGTAESQSSISAWERNKQYTYTIIIDPDTKKIKLIPVETDWVEEPVTVITIE